MADDKVIVPAPGVDPSPDPGQEQALADAIADASTVGTPGSDVKVDRSEGDPDTSVGDPSDQSTGDKSTGSVDWKSRYEELAQKSQDATKLYEMLESDPGAVEALTKYYGDGASTSESPNDASTGNKEDSVQKELASLRQQLAAVTTAMQVQAFAQRTPDFDTMRPAMHKLSQKYPQMQLDDLYRLAKAESGQSPKPLAGAEGGSGGGSAGDTELESIKKRILEAKSMDEAVSLSALYHQRGGR